jgi:antirestriction protein ArdC
MARKPSKSPEQRKAEAEALHAQLTAQVEALASTEQWTAFLRFASAFHNYSLNNVMLILGQCPEASRVAGFRKWQELGRQVRKGERAIKILGYSRKRITDKDENGDEVVKYIPRFPVLSVFDISQTDAIEGVEQPEISTRLVGEDEHGIYDRVAAYLTGLGWTVTREPIAGETNGYTTTDGSRRVVVDAALSDAQAAKTMLHEAAHVVLHTTDGLASDAANHRGVAETEAESVAYVLAGLAGVDTSAYSVGYVAGWANANADLLRSTAENVMRAVHLLAPVVLDEQPDTGPDTAPVAA